MYLYVGRCYLYVGRCYVVQHVVCAQWEDNKVMLPLILDGSAPPTASSAQPQGPAAEEEAVSVPAEGLPEPGPGVAPGGRTGALQPGQQEEPCQGRSPLARTQGEALI